MARKGLQEKQIFNLLLENDDTLQRDDLSSEEDDIIEQDSVENTDDSVEDPDWVEEDEYISRSSHFQRRRKIRHSECTDSDELLPLEQPQQPDISSENINSHFSCLLSIPVEHFVLESKILPEESAQNIIEGSSQSRVSETRAPAQEPVFRGNPIQCTIRRQRSSRRRGRGYERIRGGGVEGGRGHGRNRDRTRGIVTVPDHYVADGSDSTDATNESGPFFQIAADNPHIIQATKNIARGTDLSVWPKNLTITNHVPARNIIYPRPGCTNNAKNAIAPRECFEFFFTPQMMDIVILRTNEQIDRVHQNYKTDKSTIAHVTSEEMYAYLGLLLLSATMKNNHLTVREMFNPDLSGTRYRSVMSSERFDFITMNIRFDDKGSREQNLMMIHSRQFMNYGIYS